jgi:hypothetical protein
MMLQSGMALELPAFSVSLLVSESTKAEPTALFHQWPNYAASAEKHEVERWKATTMKSALEDAYLLHAIIYVGAAYRFYFGLRDSSVNYTRVHAYQETLKHLRLAIEAMDRGGSNPPDQMLLAVALLTMHGSPTPIYRLPSTDKEHYRDNEFYFTKPWEQAHFSALVSLTRRKGGVQNVSIDSVAGMIFVFVRLLFFKCLQLTECLASTL